MRKWTHPQGLAALVAGIYAALSPIWTTTPTAKDKNTMIALGVVTALVALFSLARPDRIASQGLIVFLGRVVRPIALGHGIHLSRFVGADRMDRGNRGAAGRRRGCADDPLGAPWP
jgi:hypothetical protein